MLHLKLDVDSKMEGVVAIRYWQDKTRSRVDVFRAVCGSVLYIIVITTTFFSPLGAIQAIRQSYVSFDHLVSSFSTEGQELCQLRVVLVKTKQLYMSTSG
jgi:hypothetical protein